MGMLVYESYKLWVWSNLIPPILPSPVPDLDGIDIKTSATTFDTGKHLYANGFTLAPDIDYRTTTTLNELPAVQFVTSTNNIFTKANDGKTKTTGLKPEIESASDQLGRRNSSKLADLLLLRLLPKTTHKENIKKINKETNGKPKAFDIIFKALNSKLQSLTSDLSHVKNSIKPPYGEIPEYYSTVINAETTTLTDLRQISQLASTIAIPQNIRHDKTAGKKLKTTTILEIIPNSEIKETLQILNDPRSSERILTQDYLIPNTNSQFTVHDKARITNEEFKTRSTTKETYRLPTHLAYYNKDSKSNQETKTTPAHLFKKVKRDCRSHKLHALHNFEKRKMRHGRLYYTKSFKATAPNTMELQIVNSTMESSTPSNIVNESNRTTYSIKTTLKIDDDEDDYFDETEVYTQFGSQSTTSLPTTLDIKHKSNTLIENEEDESESVEDTEETHTKTNKYKTHAYLERKRIEISKNTDVISTINDEEGETESGEVTKVSPATQDHTKKFILKKNQRKIAMKTKYSNLKKHQLADVHYDKIRYEKIYKKARTSKPFYVQNSAKNDVKETNYIEDESDSAETTSVTTIIGDGPEETPAKGMDILFILKTRLDKPTAATTTFESKDLLQILEQTSTKYRFVDHDTSYLDS